MSKAVGEALRKAGLTRRAVGAWAGTDHLPALAVREAWPQGDTEIGRLLALLVGGQTVPAVAAAEGLGDLIERPTPETMRATASVLPIGDALIVCDRRDAAISRNTVEWPDDSSYHLAKAIPAGRYASWLDLGCGSAIAQLVRPQLSPARFALDLNPRAAHYAALGAALSGIAIEVSVGAFADVDYRRAFDLVTCNAPIAGNAAASVWRSAPPQVLDDLYAAIPRVCTDLAVIHARLDRVPIGEWVECRYGGGFGVAWWRPRAAELIARGERTLTESRPHVDARDREDVIASRA